MTAHADGKAKRRAKKTTDKASRKNSLRAFDQLTETVDGGTKIVTDPPLITPFPREARADALEQLRTFFEGYITSLPLQRRLLLERYRLVDLAHKVVGVGSVGTRCWIVLLMSGDGDPLFLQLKEATASVLEPHVGPSSYEQSGERVVRGQQAMQATGDVFLGWSRYRNHNGTDAAQSRNDRAGIDFYFRQLWDGKASVDIDSMGPKRLKRYAWFCGGALALAHARSLDPAIIAGYIGDDETFDRAITEFATGYAVINDADHAAHRAAIASGGLEAVHDI